MFEILEHTADIGFRARGRTLQELFTASAEALSAIVFEMEDAAPQVRYPVSAEGADRESLLVNWLSEVLYLLDGRRLALRHFEIRALTEQRVEGAALGEPHDPARHRAKLIVKGVTYHQLRIGQDGEGWWAQVFLDI